jgi:hypothetical protein
VFSSITAYTASIEFWPTGSARTILPWCSSPTSPTLNVDKPRSICCARIYFAFGPQKEGSAGSCRSPSRTAVIYATTLVLEEAFMSVQHNIYLFRSGTSANVFGATNEAAGERLPPKLAPWTGVRVVRPDQTLPHGLPRKALESGIAANGYQLFRNKRTQTATAPGASGTAKE